MPNISGYQKSHQSEVIRDILTVHSCDFRADVRSCFGTNFDPRNFGGDFRHLGTSHMHLPWQVGETLNPWDESTNFGGLKMCVFWGIKKEAKKNP